MTAPIIWDDKQKVTGNRVTVDPITRLEGHGKIEIFLDDKGDVQNAYWQVPELRGFERFCIGRKVTELNQITARLCGVCPGAHHMAATKAIDGCYNTKPTDTAYLIRDTFYNAHFVHSHIAHFYALAAPDFVCGPAAPLRRGTSSVSSDASDSSSVEPSSRPAVRPRTSRPSSVESPPTP